MAKTHSLLIRSRGRALWLGFIFLVFTAWLASTHYTGGWPFSLAFDHAPDGARAAEIGVFTTSLVFMVLFGQRALDAWNQRISADEVALEFALHAFEKPVSFKWNEVRGWQLVRGGWVIVESEGGTKHESFRPGFVTIGFDLDKNKYVSMDLETFDEEQVDRLLAFLRIQIGDKEAPTIVHRDKR